MDLKYGNIMIEPHSNQPIMIDFGISVDQKALSKTKDSLEQYAGSVQTPPITTPGNAFYVYDTYTAWCFDIFLCNYIVQVVSKQKEPTNGPPTNTLDSVPTKEELESIMAEFQYGPKPKYAEQDKTRNDIFTTTLISKPVIEQFREKTIATIVSANKSWKEIYRECIHTQYTTWDNYSIAAMYLGMLDILKYSKRDAFEQIETVRNTTGKPILEEYIQIIESAVYSDPMNRPSVKDTMTRLVRLRNNMSRH
jgi:serine/threonine protein kinase